MTYLTQEQHTIADSLYFSRQDCIYCGVVFYWPTTLDERARNNARSFYCPGCGKSMVYRQTEVDKLRKQLQAEQERTAALRNETWRHKEARQHAERRVASMKGVVTKTKKRIAAGKCVRCSHEFPDLAVHMAEAHPDFEPEA